MERIENCYPVAKLAALVGREQAVSLMEKAGLPSDTLMLTKVQLEWIITLAERAQQSAADRSRVKMSHLLSAEGMILVDTCSFLHPAFPLFFNNAEPVLQAAGKKLLMTSAVRNELLKKCRTDPLLRKSAEALLPVLNRGITENLISTCGNEELSFADQQLLTIATGFRAKQPLLVITQDRNLAEDLNNINSQKSVSGKAVVVCQINQYGYLSYHLPVNAAAHSGAASCRKVISDSGFVSHSLPSVTGSVQPAYHPFRGNAALYTKKSGSGSSPVIHSASEETPLPEISVIPEDSTCIAPEKLPAEGDLVTGVGNTWMLGSVIASGGEGTVYELDGKYVAKIYHKTRLTAGKLCKLQQMVSMVPPCTGLCWPLGLLYDTEGNFVGYRMEKASGYALQRSVFVPMLLSRCFPSWERRDLVRLCVTILEKIKALHHAGVLLGDINPQNILVESPTKVWFVDCDSYQVGGYPCPVGTVFFTAPEIQGKRYSTFLRSTGNEAYAVATLLFMIMLPGKQPYSHEGGDDVAEAIRNMDFPYPCRPLENRNQAIHFHGGASGMSSGSTGAFFTGRGNSSCERTEAKMPRGKWRFVWSHLPYLIKSAFYETFRAGGRYSTEATRCSADTWLRLFQRYLWLLDNKVLQGQDPQSGVILPTRIKQVDGQGVVETRTCIDCGNQFDIFASEKQFFDARNLPLPRRCQCCRDLRRTG